MYINHFNANKYCGSVYESRTVDAVLSNVTTTGDTGGEGGCKESPGHC